MKILKDKEPVVETVGESNIEKEVISEAMEKNVLSWLCPSDSDPNKDHEVILESDKESSWWTCTCADHFYRDHDCNHIKKVQRQVEINIFTDEFKTALPERWMFYPIRTLYPKPLGHEVIGRCIIIWKIGIPFSLLYDGHSDVNRLYADTLMTSLSTDFNIPKKVVEEYFRNIMRK